MGCTKGIACKRAPLTNMHTDITKYNKQLYDTGKSYKYTKHPFNKEKYLKNGEVELYRLWYNYFDIAFD